MAGVTKKRFNLTTVQVIARDEDGDEVNLGSIEKVTLTVALSKTVAHQGGKKLPDEIVNGTMTVKGSFDRAQTDFNVMNTLINKDGDDPYFDLIGTEQVSGKTFSVFNAQISGDVTGVDVSLSDYSKQTLNFDALDYEFAN